MPATKGFQEFQLRILQSLGFASLLLAPLLLYMPADTPLLVAGYAGGMLISVYLVLMVTKETAGVHGLLLVVGVWVLTVLRVGPLDGHDVMVSFAVYGTHRLLPLLAAIFGGPRVSVGMALLVAATPVYVVWSKRGATPWPDMLETAADSDAPAHDSLGGWLTASDRSVLLHEVYALVIATVVAVGVERGLRTTLGQLSTALVAEQQCLTNMNHELRTPLVGILGMTDVLLARPDMDLQALAQLQTIQSSGRDLLKILGNIMNFSAINSTAASSKPAIVGQVSDVLRNMAATHAEAAASKHLNFTVTIDPAMPETLALDAHYLQDIVDCLVDNAIKFTAEGTVVLSFGYAPTGIADVEALVRHQGPGEPPVSEQAVVFHARHQPVNHVVRLGVLAPILDRLLGLLVGGQSWPRSRAATPSSALWVKVADTGIGIAPDKLAEVVQPFQQGDGSTTRRFGGSGLGLAIVQRLVTLIGGSFVYLSAVGRGSSFVVVLPCRPASAAPNPSSGGPHWPVVAQTSNTPACDVTELALISHWTPRPPPLHAAHRHRPLRVLVVDDNPINVRVLTGQLRSACTCDVLSVTNGQECVDLVRAWFDAESQLHAAPEAPYRLRSHTAARPPPPHSLGPIDAIFMDLNMPVMDGITATQHVRAMEQALVLQVRATRRPLPIFAVTASDPVEVDEACQQAGMNGFLRKPLMLSLLTDLMSFLENETFHSV